MTAFWHRWMMIWCWSVIGLGALFALSAFAGLRAPTLLFLDLIFWPVNGQPATLSSEAVFGIAVSGALTLGWGVLMLGLVRDRNLGPAIWHHMTAALTIWFAVDSLASIVSGASLNTVSNALLYAAYLIPVAKSGLLLPGHRSIQAFRA